MNQLQHLFRVFKNLSAVINCSDLGGTRVLLFRAPRMHVITERGNAERLTDEEINSEALYTFIISLALLIAIC